MTDQSEHDPRRAPCPAGGSADAAAPGLCVSVVIPIYNEKDTLGETIRRVRAAPFAKELILVDDGSADGTRELLAAMEGDADAKVFYHARNLGKGAALRTGFQHATGQIVIIQDADLEYNADDILGLIRPIVEGTADVVYGSRFLAGAPHAGLYYRHYLGNRLLTAISNIFTRLDLTDMETCYKVFRREVIQDILPMLKENGFGIEPELTAKVARRNYRVSERAIRYVGRTYEAGKKIRMRDGLYALWCILRYWKRD